MQIKDAAKITGITTRNIHYYIKEELLSPACSGNGYYDFSEEDIRKLKIIHAYRNAQIPVSIIRSILKKPVTASYYLNLYLRKLRTEEKNLRMIIDSIDEIRTHLPIHPDLDCIYDLTIKADIPEPIDPNSGEFYDSTMVCRLQWSAFLPETFTDYQEFLWNKVNRITQSSHESDYRLLYAFLCGQSQEFIDQTYAARFAYYEEVAELTGADCKEYAITMKKQIMDVMKNPIKVAYWKRNYSSYYAPNVRIDDSEVSRIIAEISPFFAAYQRNINASCFYLYEWLHSAEGTQILDQIQGVFQPCLNIDDCHHGELAAIASLSEMQMLR